MGRWCGGGGGHGVEGGEKTGGSGKHLVLGLWPCIYYPPRRREYLGFGLFLLQYFFLVKI